MKKNNFLIDIFLLLIISIPSFISLLNPYYFTIHDNQHPVRLYLLNEGVNQGYLYPRWVDKLTFGFGDPLFNFYPPLVYYLALIFYRLGFSLIWSIKLVFIFGFILSTLSLFFLAKKFFSKPVAFLAACLYNYLFYHAVNAYVRGALADFFSMAIIPFLFLTIINLYQKPNLKNSLFFGLALSFLILTHQLIAFPTFFFLFFLFLFYWFLSKERFLFFKYFLIGSIFGLSLSSFYWLPMFYERQFTFLDKELGGYRDHFIYPYQFWYSPWGFGGSVAGINDGMSFQIGKGPIFLIGVSFVFFVIYLFKAKKKDSWLFSNFFLFIFLMIFGLWMTTSYSDILWRNFKMLWSLQFPWRFLAPTSVFVALTAASGIYFLEKLIKFKKIIWVICLFLIVLTIFKYYQYFKPQNYLHVSDNDLVTDEEIIWKQSRQFCILFQKE
jgi:4-amino-4-deoxy-L-arabinose transferase and related glycosyltransferases of PMT family